VLSKFHTLNYIDVNYQFRQEKKHPLIAGIGVGWIYYGDKQNYKFNNDHGYGVISLSLSYKVTWFWADIRVDVPWDLYMDDKTVGPDKLFPLTLGLSYRFKPII